MWIGSCYDAEQSVDPKKCQSNEVCGYLFKGHVRRTVKTGKPKGKYDISVCMGTACYVRGAERVLEALTKKLGIGTGETTMDGKFSLRSLRCVGACGLAPVVMIGDKVYGRVTPESIDDILNECE